MVAVWPGGWESGSLQCRRGGAAQHLLTFRRWSHPAGFPGTTRALNTAARAEGICWTAASHRCRTALGTANASSRRGSRLPWVPPASARPAVCGSGRSPRFITEGVQPSPKPDPAWLCCLLPAHACSSRSPFGAGHSNTCASQHRRTHTPALSALDGTAPLLRGVGNAARGWEPGRRAGSSPSRQGGDAAWPVGRVGTSAAAAVSVRLCSRRSGTCRAGLRPRMGGSRQTSSCPGGSGTTASLGVPRPPGLAAGLGHGVICGGNWQRWCSRGEGESISPSPASQERPIMSQRAKTSPSLNATVGRCRQGILMGQNKREGEGPAHAMPRPIFTRRAPAPPAHADAPQPACSTPPQAHTLPGITRGLAESSLPEIERE